MHASLDLEYLKAARSLGIPTVLPVLSWDNLSTKGLIHVEPDLLLAWNSAHAEEAASIHRIDPRKVVVTGSPFFDKWFDPGLRKVTPRAEFLQRVGLDANRPYLLYLGSSVHIAPDERWIVERIAECFAQSSDPALSAMQIVLRPHPANLDRYRDFACKDVAIWPRRELLPADRDSQRDFLDSVRHSMLCVGINTTGMIDAIVDGHPVAALLLDQFRRTQVQTQHFQHLRAARCLYELDTIEALPTLAKRLAGGEDEQIRRRRAEFIVDFIRPYGLDRSAGDLAAACIDQLARGVPAESIQQRLPHDLAPPIGADV